MMTRFMAKTTTRVEESTSAGANERIKRETERRLSQYRTAGPEAIQGRLDELDREWDLERTLEANAATVTLVTLALGRTVDRRWYAFPALVAGFLLQHAVQGWCPPIEVFRRLGVRTPREIEEERHGLEKLLGPGR